MGKRLIIAEKPSVGRDMPEVFLGDRDEVDSWERYLQDVENSKKEIVIDFPE